MKKSLLIKTSDNRHYFTHIKNLPELIEFGNTFPAEISVVKAKNPEILELPNLAKAICTASMTDVPEYEVLETKLCDNNIPKAINSVKINTKQEPISIFIEKELLAGKKISNKSIQKKFKNSSKNTIAVYFCRVRKELKSNGHNVIKTSPGEYCIQ